VSDALKQIGTTVGWSALGLVILYAGTWLFDKADPIDYRKEIEAGNIAAAIKIGAVTVALAMIVVVGIGF
jgi:uncharacterized membrane protein YjfL (UPF0719 family)